MIGSTFRGLAAATVLLASVSAIPAAAAVLVSYDFEGAPGNQVSTAASDSATGVAGSDFTRGPGLSPNAGGDSINASGWSTAANDYFQFGFSVLSGFTASVDQLVFTARSSGSGPGALNVLQSVDGGAFTQVANFTQSGTSYKDLTLSISPTTITDSIVFRIVAANNSSANGGSIGSSGTFRITNFGQDANSPATINGTVNSIAGTVPEPGTWALLILGFGAVGGALRQRTSVKTKLAIA